MGIKDIKYLIYFLIAFVLLAHPAYARVRYYYLHRGPGLKFKVVGRIKAGEKIKVLEKKAGWVKVLRSNGRGGWISQRVYLKGWKRYKGKSFSKPLKVVLKFQNIPKVCIKLMKKSLGDFQRRLAPVGDNELDLIVSSLPRLRSYHLFLIIDFNPRYYRHAMKRFGQPGMIDLLPFNSCIWALRAYKQSLIQAVKNQGRGKHPCTFVSRLAINLVLRRLNGDEVILNTVEDGVYIYFSPVLILKRPDGQSLRVMSEEPKKVGLLSAFALQNPLTGGNIKNSKAYEVYRFFRARP